MGLRCENEEKVRSCYFALYRMNGMERYTTVLQLLNDNYANVQSYAVVKIINLRNLIALTCELGVLA